MEVQIIAEEGCEPECLDYGNAGYDLFAAEDQLIQRGTSELISLGIKTAFDPEYVALLWDRSGLSSKSRVHRFAGVIDSNYRDTWKACLFNHSDKHFKVNKGDKIIQVLFQRIEKVFWSKATELSDSFRGLDGFGSSGT